MPKIASICFSRFKNEALSLNNRQNSVKGCDQSLLRLHCRGTVKKQTVLASSKGGDVLWVARISGEDYYFAGATTFIEAAS
jgi:hypothetical protein